MSVVEIEFFMIQSKIFYCVSVSFLSQMILNTQKISFYTVSSKKIGPSPKQQLASGAVMGSPQPSLEHLKSGNHIWEIFIGNTYLTYQVYFIQGIFLLESCRVKPGYLLSTYLWMTKSINFTTLLNSKSVNHG